MEAAYSAYGLGFRSDVELAGLQPVEACDADVEIRLSAERFFAYGHESGSWFNLAPQESRLVWDGVGSYLIRGGNLIRFHAEEGALGLAIQGVLGPAMGLLLQQRGALPLHASAVVIGDVAVGVAGDSGMGKSTIARALIDRGHDLVTDDIAALTWSDDAVFVPPGHAALRLWPDSLERLGEEPEAFARLHEGTEKRRLLVDERHARQPQHLAAVVVLTDGETEELEPLTASQAAVELFRHCYFPELTGSVAGPGTLLQQCGQVAERLKVFRLRRRKQLDVVGALADLVERAAGRVT